ncbi:MAG: hypothetical protein EB034_10025 [Verrucomicrobia bacterium]|nr:hypothetical protein [Verrucomicrobiota bacterium]
MLEGAGVDGEDENSYRHSLRDDVAVIQGLLELYGYGLPVIKEMLQNSDDSCAAKLRFGWSPGLGAGHLNPLLEGPAFIVVNDGPFDRTHAENMRNLRSSVQATNGSTIGSFGVGLKSLYHLGEALLYFSSETDPGPGGRGSQRWRHGALSVWFHKEDLHKRHRAHWRNPHEDVGAVREHIAPLTDGLDRWFCLWVPLRKDSHCFPGSVLSELRPGNETDHPATELMPDDAPEQIASILPMLANVRQVTFRIIDGTTTGKTVYEVTRLDEEVSQPITSRGSWDEIPRCFSGKIAVHKWDPSCKSELQEPMVGFGLDPSDSLKISLPAP